MKEAEHDLRPTAFYHPCGYSLIRRSDPTYIARCHYLFDSMDDFLAAFTTYAAFLQGDTAHYTDLQPMIQEIQLHL
jgi:hypothetical protein